MIRASLPNIKEAWLHAYFSILDDKPGVIDYYQRNIVHSHSNVLTARQGVFDFDLGTVDLTITKWTKFTGMYIDVELLHGWINNAMNVRSYDAMFPFKITPPQFGGKKAVHQWGPCIVGMSFRRQPKPTLTFFTRAQSLGFSGIADYALLDFVCRKLAERMGISQTKIKVVIYCSNFMIKMVEVLHTLEYMGKLEQYEMADNRIGESIRYYTKYLAQDAPELKWRSANRMRTKLLKFRAGGFTSLPVSSLTLKGWEHRQRVAPKRSLRQAQAMVLGGTHENVDQPLDLVKTL